MVEKFSYWRLCLKYACKGIYVSPNGHPFELFHLDMERIGIVPKRAPAKIIDFRAHIENKHTID